MKPIDSKRFSSLSPQSRGLVPVAERRNARNQMPYRSERPMNRRLLCVPGVACRVEGPFRLSVSTIGTCARCLFNF